MIRISYLIFAFIFFIHPFLSRAQDSLSFKGQASAWILYNGGNDLPVYIGGRYIPQLNYKLVFKNDRKIDFEASANLNGTEGFDQFDSLRSTGNIKPYRLWARYSSQQFEVRAGMQKINFGSASILRPLMWFDQVDPRDPLKMTDGVWGILSRYYFLNNTNIWFWGLYGNKNPKGWEFTATKSRSPEFGGRIQKPIPTGEIALSYHHRITDTVGIKGFDPRINEVGEDRIGLDLKIDMIAGLWLEGSWTKKNRNLGIYTNQEILNAGVDYTFGIGNGLYMVYEQLIAATDEKAFNLKQSTVFSLISLSYPVDLFDNISTIVYYDWTNSSVYSIFNWQKQFNNLTFYLIGYWNPDVYRVPTQTGDQNLYAGKGIQVMLVLNH